MSFFSSLTGCFHRTSPKTRVDSSEKVSFKNGPELKRPRGLVARFFSFVGSLVSRSPSGKRERSSLTDDPTAKKVLVKLSEDLKQDLKQANRGLHNGGENKALKNRSAQIQSKAGSGEKKDGTKESERLIADFLDRQQWPTLEASEIDPDFPWEAERPGRFMKRVTEQLCHQTKEYPTGKITTVLLEEAAAKALSIYKDIAKVKGINLVATLRGTLADADKAEGDKNFDIVDAARKHAIDGCGTYVPKNSYEFVLLAAKGRPLQAALDLYKKLEDGLDPIERRLDNGQVVTELDIFLNKVRDHPENVELLITSACEQVELDAIPL